MKILFRRSYKKLFIFWILCLSVLTFYTEFYRYRSNSEKWNQIPCTNTKKTCLRILLIADPQLIGEHNEILHPLTPISKWDSDRYLVKTFEYAFNFVKPDVLVFLGDLFDEGSTATDVEFNAYVRRIFNIFQIDPYNKVKCIWLPGDNDIGGEGNDPLTERKMKRFERAFSQPEIISMKHITFYKINRFTKSIPKIKEVKEFFNANKLTIGLSHVPLMFIPSVFVDKVLTKMKPHLLFTAHEHKSMIISTDALVRTDRQIVPLTPEDNKIYKYDLGIDNMYEIVVPTCSYRMGTSKIGYGFAVVEQGELRYTVLWSPTRFQTVFVYLGILLFLFMFLIINFLFQLKSTTRIRY